MVNFEPSGGDEHVIPAHRRRGSVERRHRLILNIVTIAAILAIPATLVFAKSVLAILATYIGGFLLVLVARVTAMVMLQRRMLTRVAAGGVAVEWLPVVWTNKRRDLDAQMRNLGFETIGAFQIVSADGKTVFTTPVPAMTTPDSATIAIGAGPLSFVSDLTDGRILISSNCMSLENPGYVRQYFIKRTVQETHAEHVKASWNLHHRGISIISPTGGPEATVDKVAAILEGQASRPKPDKRAKVVLFKSDYVYRDPELVDVPMRIMAAESGLGQP